MVMVPDSLGSGSISKIKGSDFLLLRFRFRFRFQFFQVLGSEVLKPENKGSSPILIFGSEFRFPALVAGSSSALRC